LEKDDLLKLIVKIPKMTFCLPEAGAWRFPEELNQDDCSSILCWWEMYEFGFLVSWRPSILDGRWCLKKEARRLRSMCCRLSDVSSPLAFFVAPSGTVVLLHRLVWVWNGFYLRCKLIFGLLAISWKAGAFWPSNSKKTLLFLAFQPRRGTMPQW